MITQADYKRLRLILQADRMQDDAPLRGQKYEDDLDFSLRIEGAIEILVETDEGKMTEVLNEWHDELHSTSEVVVVRACAHILRRLGHISPEQEEEICDKLPLGVEQKTRL